MNREVLGGGRKSSNSVTHPCVGMIISSTNGEDAGRAREKALKLFSWWEERKTEEWCRGVSLVTESYYSPTLGYCSFAILTGGLPGPELSEDGQDFTKRYKQAEKELISYMEEINKEPCNWGALTWYRVLAEPECTWFHEERA